MEISFDPFPTLETPRLVLREIVPSDVDVIFRNQSDPAVIRYIGRAPHASIAESQALLERLFEGQRAGTDVRWGLVLRETSEFAGTCGFWKWNKQHQCAELGYEIAPSFWGKGLMVEALRPILHYGFTVMGLHRVEANIDPDNHASRRVVEKLGFQQEALLRENWFYDGKYLSSLIFGLLAHEFEAAST